MNQFSPRSPVVHDLLAVSLALAAPCIAATNSLAARGVLVCGAVLLWVLSPPPRLPRWWECALAGVLLALAAVPLLPAEWLPAMPWQQPLKELGVPLAATFSPQPWLTVEKALGLAAALLWGGWLVTHRWHLPRLTLLQIFAVGITALAAVWLAMVVLHPPPPGEQRFGFFPNRNQSANLLALGGIVLTGLAVNGWRERRPSALVWVPCLLVVTAALVRAGSRGAALAFALGAGGWFLVATRWLKVRLWLPLVAGVLLLLLAMAFLFGDRIIGRVPGFGSGTERVNGELRLLIYKDAARLAADASWHGIGLGNFSAVFARYRQQSAATERAIHPESDWFWGAAEMGWPALVVVAALLALMIRRCWPFGSNTERVLRSAALAGVLAFILHSFLDVSGHRPGTLWPALFLLGIAIHNGLDLGEKRPLLLRILPLPMTAVGVGWVLSGLDFVELPTSAAARRLHDAAETALGKKQFTNAIPAATAALRIAPVDWELWFFRGAARAASQRGTQLALQDFAVARWLEPDAKVGFQEGRAWLTREGSTNESEFWFGPEPRLAIEAWRVALAQDARTGGPELFQQMLYTASQQPDVIPYLRELVGNDPGRQFHFLRYATGPDFLEALRNFVASDPELKTLTLEQRRTLFRLWFERGDVAALENALAARADWLESAWFVGGDILAVRGELQAACQLARRFYNLAGIPAIPQKVLPVARREFLTSRHDPVAGLIYFGALLRENELKEAGEVIDEVAALPGLPSYVFALQGDFWFQNGKFDRAWRAWRRTAPN